MGNVTLPTPVFLAGGALCLVAGYLGGSVANSGETDGKPDQQVIIHGAVVD